MSTRKIYIGVFVWLALWGVTALAYAAPNISTVPATSFDFGNIKGSDVSEEIQILVHNTGDSTLHITNSYITGDTTDFYFTLNGCPAGSDIPPGETGGIWMRSKPKAGVATSTASLVIVTNDPDEGTHTISLTNHTVPPTITVTRKPVPRPSTYGPIDFGEVPIGQSATQTYTLRNVDSTTPASILSATLAGTGLSIVSNGCSHALLQPQGTGWGETCDVVVKYQPTVVGFNNAGLAWWFNKYEAENYGYNQQLVGLFMGSGVNPDPDIDVTPTNRAWGNVLVGTQGAEQTFTVKNTALSALNISSVSLTGTNANQFTVTSNGCASASLAQNQTCLVKAKFVPTALGAKTAAISIGSNDPNENPFTVALTGTGAQPEIDVTPTSAAWGNVLVGTQGSEQTFTVKNLGALNLTISGVTLTGTNANQFTVTSNGCASASLAQNQTCLVKAKFVPTSLGAKTAAISIGSNDANENPFTVALTGTGAQPEIDVTPTSAAWGNVLVGTQGSEQTFTVKNLGALNLTISGVTLTGTNTNQFTVTSNGCASANLAKNQTCLVKAKFIPTALGAKTAAISIGSNDANENPFAVTLTGTGVQPEIDVAPTSGAWGHVLVGTQGAEQTFTVKNLGATTLSISSVGLTGTNANQFSITSNGCASANLAQNQTCLVKAKFVPTALGAKTAAISIGSNDADENPFAVALTGTGVQPDIDVIPTNYAWGNVVVGDQGSEQTFTVKNLGAYNLSISSVSLTGPSANQFSITSNGCASANLAQNQTCLVKAKFVPTSSGAKTASISIASNDPDENPFAVTLTGTGIQADIDVSPLTVLFHSTVIGHESTAAVHVQNIGNAPLTMGTAVVGAGYFRVLQDDCEGLVLAQGGTCNIVLAYAPTVAGLHTGTLDVASDDPDEPHVSIALSGVGLAPDIDPSATTLDYGDQPVHSGTTQVLSLRNVGNADLIITTLSLSDTVNYSIVNEDCTQTAISSGQACDVMVQFFPATHGDMNATLTITSNDPDENPLEISLTGRGVEADIDATPTVLNFPLTPQYQVSAPGTITVVNHGNIDLAIQAITLNADPMFTITETDCEGRALTPDATCSIQVVYAPEQEGDHTGYLVIHSSDPDESELTITMTGHAVSADVVCDPRAIDFGSYALAPDNTEIVTVSNPGSAPYAITSVVTDLTPFVIQANTCTGTLSPGGSCTVTLSYAPETAGDHTGRLRIATTDPDEPMASVALHGYLPKEVAMTPVSIPGISGPVRTGAKGWPLRSSDMLEDQPSGPSKGLTGTHDVYARVAPGGISLVINGVLVDPGETQVVAAGYDFGHSAGILDLPAWVPTTGNAGSAHVTLAVSDAKVNTLAADVTVWVPNDLALTHSDWTVDALMEPVTISPTTQRQVSFTTDAQVAATNSITSPVLMVRWQEVPENLSIETGNARAAQLKGAIAEVGTFPISAQVSMYDANGSEHILATITHDITAVEPPPITSDFSPMYRFAGIMTDDHLNTYVGTQTVGRFTVVGSYPGITVEIQSTRQATVTGHAYGAQFTEYAQTTIDQIWNTETITVVTYYDARPDHLYREEYTFTAIPQPVSIVLTAAKGDTTQDTILTGKIGIYRGNGEYTYDSAISGRWNVSIYRLTDADPQQVGSSVEATDGAYSVNIGRLSAGSYRMWAVGEMIDNHGTGTTNTVKSTTVNVTIRDGNPIAAQAATREPTGPTVFRPVISLIYADTNAYRNIGRIEWFTSVNGGPYTLVEEETHSSLRQTIEASGTISYYARLTNRWSGLTSQTDPIQVQAYMVPRIVVTGPNATVMGFPITLTASITNGIECDIEWNVQKSMGQTATGAHYTGSTVTLTPDSVGSLFLQVNAREVGAPADAARATAKTYFVVRVAAPTLQRAAISGPRYVETGKPYEYIATVPALFSSNYVTDLTVAGHWILPDGSTVDSTTLTHTFTADAKTLTYETWIEQIPDVRSLSTFQVNSWTYVWPTWRADVRVIEDAVPARVKYQVLPQSISDLQHLGDETIQYEWTLPTGARMEKNDRSVVIVDYDEPGGYQPTVTITDGRGNSSTLQPNIVAILPAPDLTGTLATYVNDRWNRAPTTINARLMITSIPRGDAFASAEYSLDGTPVQGASGSAALVTVGTPGEHEITATLHSRAGKSGQANTRVTLVTGDNPACAIQTMGNGSTSLYVKAVCTLNMGYVAEYRWKINGEDAPYHSNALNFAASDLKAGVSTVEVTAITDKGQQGTASWTNPAAPPEP